MKITWEDGFEKVYAVGSRIHGLKHTGLRPTAVTLTKKELQALLSEEGCEWANRVLIHTLKDQS